MAEKYILVDGKALTETQYKKYLEDKKETKKEEAQEVKTKKKKKK